MCLNEINGLLSLYNWKLVDNRIKEIDKILLEPRTDGAIAVSLRKELAFLSDCYNYFTQIKDIISLIENLEKDKLENNSDEDFLVLCSEEINSLKLNLKEIVECLEKELYPPDKEQNRSAFMEIRAGTGGLEASLFVSELSRAYIMYAQKIGWDASVADVSQTEIGGCREIILHIDGKNVFERLRHESGVHRVQRVPVTEGSGRVHTSTVTVAVLPEAEEVEVNIDQKDLRIDTYRAGGAGGQHVNKTDSAVRITHIPSGVVVACQDERSQHKNRAKAMKILNARLFALEKEKIESKMSKLRKDQVSSADRSEKVRTYNFPQNRVTDHQVGVTINRLEFFMQGDMDEIINPLVEKGKRERRISELFASYIN
jgi:peptide chain release factor 1